MNGLKDAAKFATVWISGVLMLSDSMTDAEFATAAHDLLGKVRTVQGVAHCAERNETLRHLVDAADDHGEACWIDIT